MEVKIFPNGIYGATTYLIYDKKSLEGAIVDCTSSVDEISNFIKEKNINLKYILITHGHFDHVYCISDMKEKNPTAQVLMHKDDMDLLNDVGSYCLMAGVEGIKVPCVDGLLDKNSHNLTLGDKEIKLIHTNGHSKGGMCYLIDNILFSGDTLFEGSIGRCDLPGGSFSEIEKSIKEKLFILPEEIVVYPGHGDKTTIGYEKKYNPYFGFEN